MWPDPHCTYTSKFVHTYVLYLQFRQKRNSEILKVFFTLFIYSSHQQTTNLYRVNPLLEVKIMAIFVYLKLVSNSLQKRRSLCAFMLSEDTYYFRKKCFLHHASHELIIDIIQIYSTCKNLA